MGQESGGGLSWVALRLALEVDAVLEVMLHCIEGDEYDHEDTSGDDDKMMRRKLAVVGDVLWWMLGVRM